MLISKSIAFESFGRGLTKAPRRRGNVGLFLPPLSFSFAIIFHDEDGWTAQS
jgi:hypothetical protein